MTRAIYALVGGFLTLAAIGCDRETCGGSPRSEVPPPTPGIFVGPSGGCVEPDGGVACPPTDGGSHFVSARGVLDETTFVLEYERSDGTRARATYQVVELRY